MSTPLKRIASAVFILSSALLASGATGCSTPVKKATVKKEAPRPRGPSYLGIKYRNDYGGKRVVRVMPESPAARAGIQPGDLIVAAGGRAVTGRELGNLRRIVMTKKHGERLELTVVRRGRMMRVMTVVAEIPPGYYRRGSHRFGPSYYRGRSDYRRSARY